MMMMMSPKVICCSICLVMCYSVTAFAQESPTYTLQVTQSELNTIGNALAEIPFKTAAPIISKLASQAQVQDQLRNKPKPSAPSSAHAPAPSEGTPPASAPSPDPSSPDKKD